MIPGGKLVRDRIPERIEADGHTAHTHILTNDNEFLDALVTKLQEETLEVVEERTQPRIEELADVIEVALAIGALLGKSAADIELIRAQKAATHGAFNQRIFLEYTE